MVNAANANTNCGKASRTRLSLSKARCVSLALEIEEVLEVGYLQAQIEEVSNTTKQGIASRKSGKFDNVQYLKRPTCLHRISKPRVIFAHVRTSSAAEPTRICLESEHRTKAVCHVSECLRRIFGKPRIEVRKPLFPRAARPRPGLSICAFH